MTFNVFAFEFTVCFCLKITFLLFAFKECLWSQRWCRCFYRSSPYWRGRPTASSCTSAASPWWRQSKNSRFTRPRKVRIWTRPESGSKISVSEPRPSRWRPVRTSRFSASGLDRKDSASAGPRIRFSTCQRSESTSCLISSFTV